MLLRIALIAGLACLSASAVAQTHVRGYVKKDGTYVQPHVRSNPNATKRDNYGSAKTSTSYESPYTSSYVSPQSRDKDEDGISNQNDNDDDGDGTADDFDSTP